jgi:hypothetical protein
MCDGERKWEEIDEGVAGGTGTNAKTCLRVIGCEGMDWIELAQAGVQFQDFMGVAVDIQVSQRRAMELSACWSSWGLHPPLA